MNIISISVTSKHQIKAAGRFGSQTTRNYSHVKPEMPLTSSLLTERKNNSIIMTLNNPRFLNAANPEMVEMICSSLKEYERNRAKIDMIFIRGAGGPFSAGGDLRVMAAGALKTLKVPKISLLDGLTVGYGAGLSFCSEFQIATENTVHMMPESRIGHFCDGTSSYYLSRLTKNYGIYLALCVERSKAEDLIYSGVATHFIPSNRLDAMVYHLTGSGASSSAQIKQELNKFAERLPSTGRLSTTPGISQSEKHAVVEHCFKYNTVGEILDSLDEEGSRFSLAAKDKILQGSPSAAKLTLELLRRASQLSFKDCVLLERKLWTLEIGSHDLAEGCISKLNKRLPVWYPISHSELSFKADANPQYFDVVDSLPELNLAS